jgi:hypothetical protein
MHDAPVAYTGTVCVERLKEWSEDLEEAFENYCGGVDPYSELKNLEMTTYGVSNAETTNIDALYNRAFVEEMEELANHYGKASQEEADDLSQHYRSNTIEPIDYILANNLNFCEGNVVKYVSRHRNKGRINDLYKAMDYLQRLIDNEYKDKA